MISECERAGDRQPLLDRYLAERSALAHSLDLMLAEREAQNNEQ